MIVEPTSLLSRPLFKLYISSSNTFTHDPLFRLRQNSLPPVPLSVSHVMLSNRPVLQVSRRPRSHPSPIPINPKQSSATFHRLAYAVPPPVLLAVATLSLAALRHILSKSPNLSPRGLAETLRASFRIKFPQTSTRPSLTVPVPMDHFSRLDALRDRSIAEITALQPVPEDYSSLAPLQRRALLQSALERAYHAPRPPLRRKEPPSPPVVEETKVVKKSRSGPPSKFWNAVEQMNGRLAALGFVLCLAREVAEPGHPSLFEQVVDVVVPIAQKTPPFLVAVVDRLVDLVT